MYKPKYFDEIQGYDEFEPLELGGHVCKILKVEETKSSTGKDMINIYLDIAEGKQTGYFMKSFQEDRRENKKYGCIVYQLVLDKDGNTSKGFKTFINAVEKSNPEFQKDAIWGDAFASHFKNKLIGGVFGREQYLNQKGELKWSTKCVQFRSVETVRKGVEIPEDRYLEKQTAKTAQPSGFEVIDNSDDLPF
jgi:hypothetical protein